MSARLSSINGWHEPDAQAAAHVEALAGLVGALRAEAPRLTRWATILVDRLSSGSRLLAAGNGGSAAEAQHLTAELVGRFRDDRRPFSAIALHGDTSSLTAIGNDYGYDQVFARQLRASGAAGDVALALSTSGNSGNVLAAVEAASEIGIATIGFTGGDGGKLAGAVDYPVVVPADSTPRIQEGHLVCAHVLCEIVETTLFA